MRPIAIIDAWPEPEGEVVLARSWLFPRQVVVLRSARQGGGRVQRRTCIRLGDDVEVADRGVLTARIRQLLQNWRHSRRENRSDHDRAG